MAIVTLTSRFLITIPKSIRTKLGIKPGQRVSVTEKDGGILIIPVPDDPIRFLCGAAKGEPSMTQALLEERARDLEHE